MRPNKSGPVFSAKIVFRMFSVAEVAMPPAPRSARLPDRVLLLMLSVPALRMAPAYKPPRSSARLPDRVLLLMLSVPAFQMAPPNPSLQNPYQSRTLLPDRVLLLIVRAPWL